MDSAADVEAGRLGNALVELETEGVAYGDLALTIALHGDLAQTERLDGDVLRIFAAHDAKAIREGYGQLPAWFCRLPAQPRKRQVRSVFVSAGAAACLAPIYGPPTGSPRSRYLDRAALAILETQWQTPFHYDLFHGDVGHTLVLGATGSGKSFTLNFLLVQALQYNPRVLILDLGGSYRWITRFLGGGYLELSPDDATGHGGFRLRPFALPRTELSLQFLTGWIMRLLRIGGWTVTGSDPSEIRARIEDLYECVVKLDSITQAIPTDHDAAERQERFVHVVEAFVSDGEPAIPMQPGERPFHDPAGPAQAAAVRTVAAGEQRADAPGAQLVAAPLGVIPAVTLHDGHVADRPARLAPHAGHRVDEREQLRNVRPIGGRQVPSSRTTSRKMGCTSCVALSGKAGSRSAANAPTGTWTWTTWTNHHAELDPHDPAGSPRLFGDVDHPHRWAGLRRHSRRGVPGHVMGERGQELRRRVRGLDGAFRARVLRHKPDFLTADRPEPVLRDGRPSGISARVPQELLLAAEPVDVDVPPPFVLGGEQSQQRATIQVGL